MNETISIAQHEAALAKISAEKDSQIAHLKFELDNLKRMLFGSKSERFVSEQVPVEQLNMFAAALVEQEQEESATEPVVETITYERKKATAKSKHPGRAAIPDHFKEQVETIEPDFSTTNMVQIGVERSEWVEYKPASLVKRVILRPKYVKPEQVGDEKAEFAVGELPSRAINKSVAGNSLLAHLIVGKYVDHLPFYRQIKQIERNYNWRLHKSTVNSWFVAVCTLLEPLYEEHRKQILRQTYLQADESRIRVLTTIPRDKQGKPKQVDNKKGSKQMLGWMWVVRCPQSGKVLFVYEDNRSKKGANAVLDKFKSGYLQTDGYQSYNEIAGRPKVQRLGCWAHVRRKFFDAQKNDKKRAEFALGLIRQIYTHERNAKDYTPVQRKTYREEHLRPLFQQFKDWLDEQCAYLTPQSPIGKAFTYAQRQWSTLQTIFEDGRLLIDNNHIENKIRPLALGRKNYLFAGSHEGAHRSAMIYSFTASCKAHGINPLEWLHDTLNRIPDTKKSKLDQLLPSAEWTPERKVVTGA